RHRARRPRGPPPRRGPPLGVRAAAAQRGDRGVGGGRRGAGPSRERRGLAGQPPRAPRRQPQGRRGDPRGLVHHPDLRRARRHLRRRLRPPGHRVLHVREGGKLMSTNSWTKRLRAGDTQFGMWIALGSAYSAEVCAGAGLDWLMLDQEHVPNDIRSTLSQLQAVAAYPVEVLVRPASGDPVGIKQLLDIGATNLIVPMVDSAEQARALVAATRY